MGERVLYLLKEQGYSKKEIAKYLKITEKGLNKRLSGEKEFMCSEIYALSTIFGIRKISHIFFGNL